MDQDQSAMGRVETALRAARWRLVDAGERDLLPGGQAVHSTGTGDGVLGWFWLYAGHRLVGVVAAGPVGCGLAELIARARARAEGNLETRRQASAWRNPLPFLYATDGRRWVLRNELDAVPANPNADVDARTRRVFAVHQPETLMRWMEEAERFPDAPSLRSRLRHMPQQPFSGPKLRSAQLRAIRGLDRSLAADCPRALIQMATGAGKTFTVVAASQRLLRHAEAHRVLFLVDRKTLGEQAIREYDLFRLPGSGRLFSQEHPVQHLTGGAVQDSAKVVVSTIQRLWSMLSGQPVQEEGGGGDEEAYLENEPPPEVLYNPGLPPDAFDFIVVDECHRSIYGRWQPVLAYFDAYIIGLTATPVQQTFGFFDQNLVSEYTNEQAVADKVNVDYDVYQISTAISARGSTVPAQSATVLPDGRLEQVNTVLARIDRPTLHQRYEVLERDESYSEQELNKRVQSPDQIRVILTVFRDQLFTEIFPPTRDPQSGVEQPRENVPKTLIFAQDNIHADRIVETVKVVFAKGDDFCAKITSQVSAAEDLIQAFRNQSRLRIAVTVDMIATGTDIPALECLLFLRDVKAWSYFEQMKGRGARSISPQKLRKVTPDARSKDRFVIVDAVGVTHSDKVEARPLVRDDGTQLASLERLLNAVGRGELLGVDDTATLAGRLSRLGQRLDEKELQTIEQQAGEPLEKLVGVIVDAVSPDRLHEVRAGVTPGGDTGDEQTRHAQRDAVRAHLRAAIKPFTESIALLALIRDLARRSEVIVDHISQDRLLEARGVPRQELAERLIASWREYLAEHQDEIGALQFAFRQGISPAQAYQKLKELADRMREPAPRGWTPTEVWDAYLELDKARAMGARTAGVPELLALLRYEWGLDGTVQPYRSTVEQRFAGWLARQEQSGVQFTGEQRQWLELIVDVVATSVTVSFDSLDKGACQRNGGRVGFITAFGNGRATGLVDELDKELGA